jgi:thymidine phosphorylase
MSAPSASLSSTSAAGGLDVIDHSVGLTEVAGIGERVEPGGRPLAIVHARDGESADRAREAVRAAYTLSDAAPDVGDPVIEVQRTV